MTRWRGCCMSELVGKWKLEIGNEGAQDAVSVRTWGAACCAPTGNSEIGQEFQATRVRWRLRSSHSAPERMRGATSIKRGVSLKTASGVQGWPERVDRKSTR